MHRYLTNNFSQSESFQPLERIHFNNLIQPLETGSTIGFFQPLGLAKIGKKIQSIEILFQPLEIPTIEIGENTSSWHKKAKTKWSAPVSLHFFDGYYYLITMVKLLNELIGNDI